MATTESLERGRTRIGLIAVGIAATIGMISLIAFLNRTPQMGTDEDAFRTVDALFTAVGMRDERKLTDCEQRLRILKDTGRLPSSAAKRLQTQIDRARRGEWEDASHSLYDFMRSQRRQPE